MCRISAHEYRHRYGVVRMLFTSMVAISMPALLAGCATTPPETGAEAICADVFDLSKWIIYQRQHQDPWTQDRLQDALKGVQGREQLQQLVADAFEAPYDDDDPIQDRSLMMMSFAQQWQRNCLATHGDGFQPAVWPAAWRARFVDN